MTSFVDKPVCGYCNGFGFINRWALGEKHQVTCHRCNGTGARHVSWGKPQDPATWLR